MGPTVRPANENRDASSQRSLDQEVLVVNIQRWFAWLALFLIVGLPVVLAACGKGGTGGY